MIFAANQSSLGNKVTVSGGCGRQKKGKNIKLNKQTARTDHLKKRRRKTKQV